MGNQVWNTQHYDHKLAFVSKFGEDLLSLLQAKEGEAIVDLGCGSGHLAAQIALQKSHVIGLDYSTEMITQAQQNYPHIPFKVANAESFQLDSPVDAIFSNAALHWVKNAEGVVQSVFSNLKSGGRFVAEFGGQDNVAVVTNAIEDVLLEHFHLDAKSLNPWYFPSIAQYTTLLEDTGFYVKYAEHIDRPTPMVDGDVGLLYNNGTWYIDYKRIRVIAYKK